MTSSYKARRNGKQCIYQVLKDKLSFKHSISFNKYTYWTTKLAMI